MSGHGFKPIVNGVWTSAACTCGWRTVHGHGGDRRFVDAQVRHEWDVHTGATPADAPVNYSTRPARYLGSINGVQARTATLDGAYVYRWREPDGSFVVTVGRWLPGDWRDGQMTEVHRRVFRA